MKSSRRNFIKQNAKLGLSAAFSLSAGSSALEKFSTQYPPLENEPIIDIHQHANYSGRAHDQFIAHQRKMGISKTLLLPSGRPVVTASTHEGFANGLQAKAGGNEVCYALTQQYPNEFYFGANEVPDIPEAIGEIEKYLKLGAKVIAESKFGVECDAPEMQEIYSLAQEYDVPVLMHWQHEMYNYGFDRFYKMLEKYPRVNFIGHAQSWWANIDKNHRDQSILYPKGKVTAGGITDSLLSDYPNMYGDMSAGSGLNALLRDEEHAQIFLKRHQDKLLYGSDCNDGVGEGKECQGAQTIAAIKRLSASKSIERKLLYENAKKLFKL
ncbi:putative TIM-barrel fold metal-dependent hydrolase [Catalinimonas alkaloidigena]|uniref:amidohydrolase family protein n=1 Tax=Catalinimonas alkaloidigena TaxID=1075417 RepID=UPI0024063A8C|nr:amidohydrolase [Catalinimonas alkaloidigena]MDF9796521.1 putative TIM-barrel fold metal-dependent hydrolase [Catalinimonas alkaloidigena]